jgi:hypothetical protein
MAVADFTGVMGAGISAISSLLGQKANNKTQKEIAQMTNDNNMAMLDKQIAYNKEAYAQEVADNWEMWNATNEYNSAASQVERYKEAGINPYLAMSGTDAGTATSTAAPQMAGINTPTSVAPQVNADWSTPFKGIINEAINTAKNYQELQQSQMNTQYQQTMIETELAQKMEQTKNLTEQRGLMKAQTEMAQLQRDQMPTQFLLNNQLQKAQIESTVAQTVGQKIANTVADQSAQVEINTKIANLANLEMAGKLTATQIKKVKAEIVKILNDADKVAVDTQGQIMQNQAYSDMYSTEKGIRQAEYRRAQAEAGIAEKTEGTFYSDRNQRLAQEWIHTGLDAVKTTAIVLKPWN